MRKTLFLSLALTLSAGLWANELDDAKTAAIAEIETAGVGIQNAEMNNWINGAITDINAAGTDTKEKVDNIKTQILSMIQLFQDGKAEGKAEALGAMAEPCTGCTAVEVTDGTTTVTLYNPTNVSYIKVPSED